MHDDDTTISAFGEQADDLPQEMRGDPYCRKNTGRLTKIVWQRAQGSGLEPPFGLDRMSDRIVVRKLKPADAQRAEVAA